VSETAVANTGPLLHLSEIGLEKVLTIFERVIVSEQVKAELIRHSVFDRLAETLSNRFMVQGVTKEELEAQGKLLSGFKVHRADLSVAALAFRLLPDVVLTDDLELRKGLEAQGHTVVGSVGVLIRAFRVGLLTKAELKSHLDRLFDGSTLYLSKAFRTHVRKLLKDLID